MGKRAARSGTVAERGERDVDRVGKVEGLKVGGAAKVDDLRVGFGREHLGDFVGAAAAAGGKWVDGEEIGYGARGLKLPGVVVPV